MKKEFTDGYHGIYFQPGSAPVFCYRSGLTVYEETFSAGSLNASGWNTAGYPSMSDKLPFPAESQHIYRTELISSEIDGEYCDRGLEYVSFNSY